MIRKEILKYYFLILTAILICSCQEITDWKFKPGDNDALVVQAIITDEFKKQEILLSLSYNGINDQPDPVSDAEITIIGGNETYYFYEDPVNPGRYQSDKIFSAILNVDYKLEISWNNRIYKAENNMVQVIPFTPVTFKQFQGTDSLTFDQIPPAFSPHEQAMYEIDIDWSHIFPSDTSKAKVFYYTFSTLDVNEIFKPGKQTVIFPKGSTVIEKKYSLNPQTAQYFRALTMENEWQGAAFDEASAEIPTNISSGGLGYFCVCAVLTDTLIAQ